MTQIVEISFYFNSKRKKVAEQTKSRRKGDEETPEYITGS